MNMYTGVIVAAWVSTVILTWLGFNHIQEREKIESIKEDMELSSSLGTPLNGTGEFISTDEEGLPEIVVRSDTFDQMPEVEEEFTKEEVLQNEPDDMDNIPEEINLDIPFYPQAPDGDWSLPWKEACEEASVVQAYYFLKWKELSKEKFKSEVLDIVEIQKDILGKYIDSSMSETAQFLEEKFNYTNYEIIDNPTVEQMKYELAQGHPIIAPFAGKELGNSFFTNGWPRYHVLVIVGYNDEYFITNDVWTSRGENFAYSYEVIMDSMHDLIPLWEGDILNWEKRILVMR